MTEQKPGWYENKAAVILWLVFFFPAGLYGIWKSSQFSDKAKWIVTGFFAFLIFIAGIGDNKKNRSEVSNQSSSPPAQTVAKPASPSSPPADAQTVAKPASPPSPPAEEQDLITWSEIDRIYNIRNGATDLQKKEAWKRFKGKKVTWSGQVSEISDGFTGLKLQVKMNRNTLTSDVLIRLKKSARDKALQLKQGDYVEFTGHLDDWGSIMPITIDDGEIL